MKKDASKNQFSLDKKEETLMRLKNTFGNTKFNYQKKMKIKKIIIALKNLTPKIMILIMDQIVKNCIEKLKNEDELFR